MRLIIKSACQHTQNIFFGFIKKLVFNFATLTVKNHQGISVVGFVIILMFILQIVSGICLALSLVPEVMLIPSSRDEEDADALFTDDFFWIHERGVDIIFIFSYVHLARKLYLLNNYLAQEFAWKSGAFALMIIQVVTFLGLVLCSTHLSDITLKIASNTMHQIFNLKTKVYWWLFTDKNLNTDTIIRLAYAHYIAAFILFGLVIMHAVDMHYDWKTDYSADGLKNELQWWNEVVINEIATFIYFMLLVLIVSLILYSEPEAVSYELFMWGDIGFITDPNFNQVAPHWYFRPLMAFLLVIPHALIGVFGLALFFILIYYQISLHNTGELRAYKSGLYKGLTNTNFFKNYTTDTFHVDFSFTYQLRFFLFFFACLYTTTFLPNGKYYLAVGGNDALLASYMFIFIHLTFPSRVSMTTKKTII